MGLVVAGRSIPNRDSYDSRAGLWRPLARQYLHNAPTNTLVAASGVLTISSPGLKIPPWQAARAVLIHQYNCNIFDGANTRLLVLLEQGLLQLQRSPFGLGFGFLNLQAPAFIGPAAAANPGAILREVGDCLTLFEHWIDFNDFINISVAFQGVGQAGVQCQASWSVVNQDGAAAHNVTVEEFLDYEVYTREVFN